jgi:hypothetical protein
LLELGEPLVDGAEVTLVLHVRLDRFVDARRKTARAYQGA